MNFVATKLLLCLNYKFYHINCFPVFVEFKHYFKIILIASSLFVEYFSPPFLECKLHENRNFICLVFVLPTVAGNSA